MRVKEYRFKSANGFSEIYGIAYAPDGAFMGYIQLVHDCFDHIGRYAKIMKTLCANGYVVFGHDHMGHGKSVGEGETPGCFPGDNNQLHLVEDVQMMFYNVVSDFKPDISVKEVSIGKGKKKQVFDVADPTLRGIIGIGLGSAIAKAYVVRYNDCNAVIFCGDRGFPAQINKELRICRSEIKKLGSDAYSDKLVELTMGSYNDNSEEEPNSWRLNNKFALKKYNADALCRFQYNLKSWEAMLEVMSAYRMRDWVVVYPKYLPTFFMSGLMDPVSRYTRDLDTVLDQFRYSNIANVFYTYYEDNSHDLFFDNSQDKVLRDALLFMNRVCSSSNT